MNFIKALRLSPPQSRPRTPLLPVLFSLTWLQWAHFTSGLLAWTCDAMDFYSVSLSLTSLSNKFQKDTHDITTAITLSLLLRAAGALIFGTLSDRYGRKYPMIANLLLVTVLEVATAFVRTYPQFLAVRSLFGIGMGGIWGLSASTALENLPVDVRGLASGVLQQGYALGCLLASVVNITLVPAKTVQGKLGDDAWRSLFWLAGELSFFTAAFRAILPESEQFIRGRRASEARGISAQQRTQIFLKESAKMLRLHWGRFIYAVFMMAGFTFLSHGSQDLYPTFLRQTKGFTEHDSTMSTIIGFCGAIIGGALCGWVSQYIGRRQTAMLYMILIGAFIPLWILPKSFTALTAGAFFMQFAAQGCEKSFCPFGCLRIPIQLSEISPPAFRASFPGIAYQLGSMISSASAQIEANYGTVQGILIGTVAAFLFLVMTLGPENHGMGLNSRNM
ncbi:MFS general substrate transporter [Dendrothele bispora CBS 962.96]|uniref:MFS general substrate transporter n=1 Tax=Dendrothele bispora (strain CBS 962.96) TaxID=1314807 RepID=A0A4S8LXQ5_DENBC|nr:MFS general substrate transporter [Dendrothele bispora CBS 962.96]